MIHPTAIVEAGAEIDESVEIGPYSIIGPQVKIGPGCVIGPHVVVRGRTTLGPKVQVFQFASVGENPQDLKFHGEPGRLEVGEGTVIRESATLHIGTADGGLLTKVGSHCLLMAYSHVAHDCVVGDRVIMANCAALAGHVTVGDHAILSGQVAVHQFTRVGRHAFLSGGSLVTRDVMHYCVTQGDRACLTGINKEGLRRHGFSPETIRAVRNAYRTIFREGRHLAEALDFLDREVAPQVPEVAAMVEFARSSKRSMCPARRTLTRE